LDDEISGYGRMEVLDKINQIYVDRTSAMPLQDSKSQASSHCMYLCNISLPCTCGGLDSVHVHVHVCTSLIVRYFTPNRFPLKQSAEHFSFWRHKTSSSSKAVRQECVKQMTEQGEEDSWRSSHWEGLLTRVIPRSGSEGEREGGKSRREREREV